MAGLPAITWKAFFIWSAFGLVTYFFYSRSHSELAEPDSNKPATPKKVEQAP